MGNSLNPECLSISSSMTHFPLPHPALFNIRKTLVNILRPKAGGYVPDDRYDEWRQIKTIADGYALSVLVIC